MGLSRKGWVLLTTAIFISLVFAFYFLVYVKGNERKIIENNLRVLTQMKGNITNLLESEKKIAENQVDEFKDSLEEGEKANKDFPGWSQSDSNPDSPTYIFEELDSAVWKIVYNKDSVFEFKKSYHELFENDLIERKDIFEFITISTFKDKKLKTIYSNFPLGHINYPDDPTVLTNFTSKNLFEIDYGHNQYLAFNAQLGGNGEYEAYLTGYVNQVQFNDKKREVSVFFITAAVILTIIMILAFPILKLRIMNNEERLNRKDVFITGVSLVIGPSLLILFFLFFTTNTLTDKPLEKVKLEELHRKLAKNFNTEINNAIEQLKIAKNELPKILDTTSTSPLNTKNKQLILKNILNNENWENNFKYFNSIFWTDNLGLIKIYLSSEENPTQIRSLNHRKYVMNISNGNYQRYKDNDIAIESIRSVSDGNYEIGLGMVSGDNDYRVLATSFSLASLMQPILEEGYGFCLFNSEGRALFHSEIKRNLNENFLDETGKTLNAYVKSGVSHHTSVSYMDKDHYMYLNKIPELDGYFLATFVQKAYTHSPNAIAINMTIEMQLAFLSLLFVFYLILYASALKRSKLKQRVFLFNWLKPFTGFEGANKYIYIKLLGVNVLIFAYMIISWIIFYRFPDLLIHSILGSGVLVVALHFWILSKALPENERMYTQFHQKKSYKFISIILVLGGLFLFIGKILLINYSLLLGIVDVVILSLTGYGIFRMLTHNLGEKRKQKITTLFQNKDLLDYKVFVFSLIVLISFLPTLMFFSINYNKEKEILFKYKTVALERNIDHWKEVKKAQFYKEKNGTLKPIIGSLDDFIRNMKNGCLNYAIPSSLTFGKKRSNKKPNPSLYDNLYSKARIEFDFYGINSQGFIKNGDSKNWVFNKGGVDFFGSKVTERITGLMGTFSSLAFSGNGLIFFIFLVILGYAIFGILKNVVNKIFGLDFKNYADKLVLTEPYKEIANKLVSIYEKAGAKNNSFNNSFIVGVNASHVYEIKETLQNWKKDKFFTLELLDLPNIMEDMAKDPNQDFDNYFTNSGLNFQILIKKLIKSKNHNDPYLITALKDKHQLPNSSLMVFVEHFEFSYDNLYLNKVKLNILQRLVTNPSIRVVVSSEISPVKLFEFYEDKIKKMEKLALKCQDHHIENREKIEEVKGDYKNWLHLFGGFFRITIPIEKKKNVHKITTLNEELEHGQYLEKLSNKYYELFGQEGTIDDTTSNVPGEKNILKSQKDKINENTRKDDIPPGIKEDDYILNIQETSYSYYFAIWNSLSKEERYIVYDIAHDSFVNSNNVDGIIDLLQKGILIYDHSLRLMNESFTNFVLTKVNSDEALERELESAKGGKWNTVSAVILLIIISLIVFISFGKINMLEDVNALLGSLAAIITLVLRMGGIFVFGKGSD